MSHVNFNISLSPYNIDGWERQPGPDSLVISSGDNDELVHFGLINSEGRTPAAGAEFAPQMAVFLNKVCDDIEAQKRVRRRSSDPLDTRSSRIVVDLHGDHVHLAVVVCAPDPNDVEPWPMGERAFISRPAGEMACFLRLAANMIEAWGAHAKGSGEWANRCAAVNLAPAEDPQGC